jgi:hypothetical protein
LLDDLRALVELPRPGPSPRAVETEEATTPSTIQHTMWNYVGIVRTYERLKRALADMNALGNRLTKYYHESTISKAIVEGSATSGYSRSDTGDRSLPFRERRVDRECPGPRVLRSWLAPADAVRRTSPLDGSIYGANASASTPTFRWSRSTSTARLHLVGLRRSLAGCCYFDHGGITPFVRA